MVEKIILLNEFETVRTFVNQAMLQSFDVDLVSGKYTVNAKSIMGVFSLDLTKPVTVVAHCEENDQFSEFCEKYRYQPK